MNNLAKDWADYWDETAKDSGDKYHFDELIADQFRRVHLNLFARWVNFNSNQRILKTDLFAEALCPSRSFLWDILKINGNVVGIDISMNIIARARNTAAQYAPARLECVNCDIRQLPFAPSSFDLVISDSTLDHFHHEGDILRALSELSRVLKSGGTLVITMDNRTNLADPLLRFWANIGLSPIFLGKTYSMKELREALTTVGLCVMNSTAIIHNPRFVTWTVINLIRKIEPYRFNRLIRRGLELVDTHGQSPWHFTGQALLDLNPGPPAISRTQ